MTPEPSRPSEPVIRPYRDGDEAALMEVCLRTGAAGGDASALVADGDLFGAIWCLPYLRLAPELASVVVAGGAPPVGYVLGALDTVAFEAAAEERYWPTMRENHPTGSVAPGSLDEQLVGLIHHPLRQEDRELLERHPSHLHIDLLPEVQGIGLGRRLVDRLCGQLAERGSPGVHLGVSERNGRAIAFYRHLGFEEWSSAGPGATGTLTMVRQLPTL